MEKKIEYTNGEVTIVWKPDICIHSAKCAHGLPSVFKPTEKPWIQPKGASSSEIMEVVDRCPSGALTYYQNGSGSEGPSATTAENVKVEVAKGGPLLVAGPVDITHDDGSTETKKRTTAFCRCGQSGNQPFCDGSHKNQ